MKKKRVLYINYSPHLYGDNRALLNILDGVTESGVHALVVLASKGKMCNELEERHIDYKIIKHYFSVYPSFHSLRDFLLYFLRFLRSRWFNHLAIQRISSLVKSFKPDLIHTNVGPVHVGFHAAKRSNIPHVWHIREYQDLDFGWHHFPSKGHFSQKLLDTNNYPIAISEGVLGHYSLHNKARMIYDGVMKESQIQFIFKKEKYFLFVGRLEEAKGLRILIEAYIEFCRYNSDFELRIAGDKMSSYKTELHRIVEDAKLAHRVRFLGFRNDVYELMANATALVVPSRHEGFGFITVEAMFNGCLVIGNCSAGTKEILEKENLGILYSGHDELVAALKSVVSNGIERYFPVIKKAQERAAALYSIEQNVSTINAYYQDILDH